MKYLRLLLYLCFCISVSGFAREVVVPKRVDSIETSYGRVSVESGKGLATGQYLSLNGEKIFQAELPELIYLYAGVYKIDNQEVIVFSERSYAASAVEEFFHLLVLQPNSAPRVLSDHDFFGIDLEVFQGAHTIQGSTGYYEGERRLFYYDGEEFSITVMPVAQSRMNHSDCQSAYEKRRILCLAVRGGQLAQYELDEYYIRLREVPGFTAEKIQLFCQSGPIDDYQRFKAQVCQH